VLKVTDAREYIAGLAHSNVDVYFGVCPVTGPARDGEKGTAEDVTRLAGLWADLDVKPGACPNLQVVRAIIRDLSQALGTRPSATTHSGNGLQPYWTIIDGNADNVELQAIMRRWGRLVNETAEKHDATADSVFNLDRILRVPGTYNCKAATNGNGGIPALCFADDGDPLTLAEIEERLSQAGIVEENGDRTVTDAVLPTGWDTWEPAAETSPYVAAMIDGWADDRPTAGRHQRAACQSVRLACAGKLGRLTEADWGKAQEVIHKRLVELRAETHEAVPPLEVPGLIEFGIEKAATKTVDEMWADLGETPPVDEEAFWTARPILKHICASSLARQMDPRGVLVVDIARAIASIPPYVTLPGITAARASLNIHVALVGPSSGGKSSSVAVAKEALAVTPEPEVTSLGSGEGIAKQYAYRDAKTKKIVTVTDTLLFNDTEIESVEVLAKRAGNPLMGQWRKTYTGERLGFGYADPKNRIPVLDHRYRFCQILGIQPELAGWLLTGTQAAGGTPQRILWAPVVYPDMPKDDDLPEWPGQQTLAAWPELPTAKPEDENEDKSTYKVKWPRLAGAVDDPADENLLRRHELKVPTEAEAVIREARYKFHHGEVDHLRGHSTLTRLKVAAGLMWLDGHTSEISSEDWELASIVMGISDATLAETEKLLAAKRGVENKRRGRAEGERAIAADDVKQEAAVHRVAENMVRHLQKNGGEMARIVLRNRKIAKRDRDYFR
jgi:hypothetical protein